MKTITEKTRTELESARREFDSIIAALGQSYMDYQISAKDDLDSVVAARNTYSAALDKSIKGLHSWNDRVIRQIEQGFVSEGIGIPKRDDPFLGLIIESNVWLVMATLERQKRRFGDWRLD